MSKQRRAILMGVVIMIATVVVFVLMPKPVMYSKMYIQLSFLLLAELICICSYVMLADQEHHLKTVTLGLFFIVELVFNALIANLIGSLPMILTNVALLALLGIIILIENKWGQ